MATEVEQRSTNNGGGGGGVGHDMVDMDNDTILSRTERRPLTLSRRRIFYQAPEFIQRLSGEDTVVEGATAKFECVFKGFPLPTVTWFKNDVQLELNNRVSLEAFEQGTCALVIKDVIRSDEAPYQCRIENSEGSSSSTLYLSVKGSSRSPKRKKSLSPNRRMVSYPSLFPTIEEKIVEEEKEEEEVKKQEPSPLTQLYEGNKLRSRHTWPKFVGDWAFADDDDAGPCAKGDDDVDGHGGLFYSSGSNEDDDVFAETIPSDMVTHAAPLSASNLNALDPRYPASDSNSLGLGGAHCTARNSSHSSLSASCPHLSDNGTSSCKASSCSSRHCTFCNSNNHTNSNQSVNMTTSLPTGSDRDRLENDQSLAGRRRHRSGDTEEDPLTGAWGGNTASGQDSVASGNQPAVIRKKLPPPKGQRKRPPRKTMNNIGGVLATSFLLSSFTFCALCIETSPEIFIVVIFIAAFMFQVIQQLNAM